MQNDFLQTQTQPFAKLARANMDLLTQFTTSPEVTSQTNTNASQFFQQASESAMKVMQSGAFAQMMQGMLKNYTEFFTDLGKSSMAMMSQAPVAMARQVQEATERR